MLLTLAWGVFGVTGVIALTFGMLLWSGLTRTHLDREKAAQYVVVYSVGAAVILTFMLVMPL